MFSLRLAVVTAVLMSAVACGNDYSSSPTAPTPTPTPEPTPAGPTASVTIPVGAEFLGNRAFAPGDLNIDVGTTVTWMNTDSIPHTSTSDQNRWNSGTLAAGGRFSFTFQSAGSFPYHCSIHPGMVGTVVVR